MAAGNHRGEARPEAEARRPLGRWEWAALPEFGISCIRAELFPDAATSRLAAGDLVRLDPEGVPGLRFRVYPLAGDERTFVLAEAPLAGVPAADRRPRIRTLLRLGEESWPVELELVPRRSGSPALRLGRGALAGRVVVVDAEALAGLPRTWLRAFDPDENG